MTKDRWLRDRDEAGEFVVTVWESVPSGYLVEVDDEANSAEFVVEGTGEDASVQVAPLGASSVDVSWLADAREYLWERARAEDLPVEW